MVLPINVYVIAASLATIVYLAILFRHTIAKASDTVCALSPTKKCALAVMLLIVLPLAGDAVEDILQEDLANTNDVAGWFMRASYDFVYADASTQSNSLDRVLDVYLSINTPAYRQSCILLDADVAGIKLWLSRETPAQHAETLEKGSRPGRLPHYIRQLKALDDDGYFDNN